MSTYMVIEVDDDAEHVHPAIYLTKEAALNGLKKKVAPMIASELYERLEAVTTFETLYELTGGCHWGDNAIKLFHVIKLAKAEPVF